MSISQSIAAFSNSIAATLAPAPPSIPPLPPTPVCHSQAISVAQTEKTYLTHFEIVAFIDVLHYDCSAIDVYFAL
ncbi:hypothetical protein AN958_04113 [Leucoagaricus sp. SymC.cos]|nr:hypothetical protein AN958_04113 [Leucoagaricus sp. SymC.cos]